jgi:hypothetical protein
MNDKCPVPGCELKPPHVPYVTDFCHACGGKVHARVTGGRLCDDCNIWYDDVYCSGHVLPFRPKRKPKGSWDSDMTPYWCDWIQHLKACEAMGQRPMTYPEYFNYRSTSE